MREEDEAKNEYIVEQDEAIDKKNREYHELKEQYNELREQYGKLAEMVQRHSAESAAFVGPVPLPGHNLGGLPAPEQIGAAGISQNEPIELGDGTPDDDIIEVSSRSHSPSKRRSSDVVDPARRKRPRKAKIA